jgi:hypothetical protein
MSVLTQPQSALDRETVRALAEERAGPSVSLYLPTHAYGPDTRQDPIRLANVISHAREQAKALEWPRGTAHELLRPVQALLEDREFWRYQKRGLAIFLSADRAQEFRLDESVEEFALAGDGFNVRPLVPSMARSRETFYILALSRNAVRLLQCTPHTVEEVELTGVPRRLEDSAGHDYEERSLQFHTGAAPRGDGDRAAQFHGQGRTTDKSDQELEKFLREVHDGLAEHLPDKKTPIVLACDEPVEPVFRRVNKSLNVLDRIIPGNADEASEDELLAAGLEAAAPDFEADAKRVRNTLSEHAGTERVCAGIHNVLPLAEQGRLEALLVDCSEPLWGRYEETAVEIADDQSWQPGLEDLLDQAISFALSTGTEVYPAAPGELTEKMDRIAGLVRF